MNTSYFAKINNNLNNVSIAGKAPDWYKGREYKKLAPKYWFFKKYKEDNDEQFYINEYYKILNQLDPSKVFEELGENSVLLCYEKPGEFCHRHLVAKWLMDNLNIKILEI